MTEGALKANQKNPTKSRTEGPAGPWIRYISKEDMALPRDPAVWAGGGGNRAIERARPSHAERRMQDWKKEKEDSGGLVLPQRCHL